MAERLTPDEDTLKQPEALDDNELDGVTGGAGQGNVPKYGTSGSGTMQGLEQL